MKLKITDARLWYLWMLAGALVGIAIKVTAQFNPPKAVPQINYMLACYLNICFS